MKKTLVLFAALAAAVRSLAGGVVTGDAEAASVSFGGSAARVDVKPAKDGLWYAIEKTADLSRPFVVDAGTWVSGKSVREGKAGPSISRRADEPQSFYRVVVSDRSPAM